ncbi:MAG: hypothetical protein CVU39_24930 [Chloroflexi bacterium HGW-Chloroflexi-10]|nr:MAG: hypothetical protein CVU39_24930 [Chloroflexi bacterium HGW-Chloroflexi-10]
MSEHVMISIGMIVILGVLAQWAAWRLKQPSILLLLLFGFLAGPVFGILNPDETLGELLFPAVSLSVGIILFEGGLSLRLENLRAVRGTVRNLISLGALVTLAVAAPAAHFLLDMSWSMSILLASIVVVSGPTVVIPLLRFIRPNSKLAAILRWEGILIDPIGATLAVLVFEAIRSEGTYTNYLPNMVGGMLMMLLVGGALGAIAAFILIFLFERRWVPNYLQTPLALITMLAMFLLSNSLVHESGLMVATVMGIVLANQKRVNIKHIIEFKEQLGVLLLSVLFIVLSARVDLDDFIMIGWGGLAFLAVLIFIARPLGAWLSSRGNGLNNKEVLFLGWMAPRGIVAMSVASLFSLNLERAGIPGSEKLVAVTILVVVGTVLVYSLTAGPLARRLDLVAKDPQGVLLVGAHPAARAMAQIIQEAGFKVVLVDTRESNVIEAQESGLLAINNSIFSDTLLDQLPLSDLGYLLALTPDDQVNSMAALSFEEYFGKKHVYQLNPENGNYSKNIRQRLHAPYLFQCEVTYGSLDTAIAYGGQIHIMEFKNAAEVNAYQLGHGEKEVLLFTFTKNDLRVATCDTIVKLQAGHSIISLQLPPAQPGEAFWEHIHPNLSHESEVLKDIS